jgi:hypothetical protein
LALFGGYRSDNYNAVLDLHIKSLLQCAKTICQSEVKNEVVNSRKLVRV